MLFLFDGVRSTQLLKKEFERPCSHCDERPHILEVHQRYFHIFLIPFFALPKKAFFECLHCKKKTLKKEMTPDELQLTKDLTRTAKTPLWTFSGIILSIMIVAWALNHRWNYEESLRPMITNPKVGDVVAVRVATDNFQVYKVTSVLENQITYVVGTKVYTSQVQASRVVRKDKFERDGFFYREAIPMDRSIYESLDIKELARD